MTETRDVQALVAPMTADELDAGLLEITGDLDKARVLRERLPLWMVQAPPQTLSAIEQAHSHSETSRRELTERLRALQPLDRFCAEKLRAYLIAQGHIGLDVRRDYLERPRRQPFGVGLYVTGVLLETARVERPSLLQAAMQNFTAAEAEPGGLPDDTVIRRGEDASLAPGMTARQFVGYCRALDLGSAYQAHLREVFSLPAPGEPPLGLSYNAMAVAVGSVKRSDVLIDLHIALGKQHISAAIHARLLSLINADVPAGQVVQATAAQTPLIWQGLNIDGACLWSVVVFGEASPGELPARDLIVYMPNEPVRPWYEYPSLQDFEQYLTLKLQVASYRQVFGQYLDESERLNFFTQFDQRQALGAITAVPVLSNLSDFFFRAYVGKLQLDARLLAVPVEQVDEDARQQRWLNYLGVGLDVLNVASFVVPVLGQLMMGVAIGQLLGEVFDGVEDWSHHDNAQALRHLVNVVEDIAAMVLFAAGGRVVGSLKRSLSASTPFFDGVEAVRHVDGQPRLWRPRLSSYRPGVDLQVPRVNNSRGVYQANGKSYIRMDGHVYDISYDPAIGLWRINHPRNPKAYRPPLKHNHQGGWQQTHERPQSWTDPVYHLRRLAPGLADVPAESLQRIAAINQVDLEVLQQWAQDHQALPQRFQDGVARWRQHRKVLDLIETLENGHAPDPVTARTQILALALMPGWPEGRFFEVLDEEGYLLVSYPDLAPFDYEDRSIHITEQQLRDGQVTDTLLLALTEDERHTLLGQTVELKEAPALLTRRLLDTVKDQHHVLYRKLYEHYNGFAFGEWAALCAHFPRLPRRVAWELFCDAPGVERHYLRKTGRVSLGLAQRSRVMLDLIDEDQALMGLYWPELADASTRRAVFGMLGRLAHWPKDLLLQLREGSLAGPVLDQVGAATAAVRRTILHTAEGFQAFDERAADLNTRVNGPDGLLQAVVDCLSAAERRTMNLVGEQSVDHLRSQLRFKSQDERGRIARYLWPERVQMEEDEPAVCIQSQLQGKPGPAVEFAPALVRKVGKLYPGMSPAQICVFLQGAGHDHLSRAKAVQGLEVELGALQQALKRWASDRRGHTDADGPLWDYRLRRAQASKAIERCWRGQFIVHDAQRLDVPGLTLDGMTLGSLPPLPPQVRFDRARQVSLRNMGLGDDVTYFLKHFTRLRSVDLADNRLTRLPEALSLMPDLDHLRLARNRLQLTQHTRKKLAEMRGLKSLDLAGNPLIDSPDVGQLRGLRELILRDCRLKDFPASARGLPYLEQVDLRENDIAELPDWLLALPRERARAFNLRHNPLSTVSRAALGDYRQRVGVGMGFLEDDISRLNEQRARDTWLADEHVADYADKDLAWSGLKNEPGSDGLFTLLAELGHTSDARQVREDMSRRVWQVLDATAADADLREEIFQRAATPLNCDDAVSVNFSSLEVLVEIHQASRAINGKPLTAKPLLKLAKGLFRLDQLEHIARRHSLEHPGADPLEVSLAFRTGLKGVVYLPGQPQGMLHSDLAKVSRTALDQAQLDLKAAELSPALLKYIVELPFWREYLKRTHASRFEALNAPFSQRMQDVFDNALELQDAEYRARMNEVHRDQRQAEVREVETLTQDALRLDDFSLCAPSAS